MVRFASIVVALILGLPFQLASFNQTMTHLSEFQHVHDSQDPHSEHDGDHEHDTEAEHSHGDGSPAHSHANDLAGVLAPASLTTIFNDFNFSPTYEEVSDSFVVKIPTSESAYLLLFRPPIFA
ncbi:MAG: hypothetical protein H7318_19130 [Oligoflexus sp.]|nr:hypothetical protein [Oligoflexus sp.]